jgi:hypothetical protein
VTINPGGPDWMTGVVSPQKVIGSFLSSAISGTVGIPSNAEALWVIPHGSSASALFSVKGVTTGINYPFFAVPPSTGGLSFSQYVVIVAGVEDQQVTFNWLVSAPGVAWDVVADGAGRFVLDMALASASGEVGGNSPFGGVQVLGANSGVATVLETDANGRLIPLVPTMATGFLNTTSLIPAPTSGAWYLFEAELNVSASGDQINIGTGGFLIAALKSVINVNYSQNLHGYRTTGAVTATYAGATPSVNILYAAGP